MLKGVRHVFSSILFSLAESKNFAGNHSVLCFRKFLVAKKFTDKKGEIKFFYRNFFVSQCRKAS